MRSEIWMRLAASLMLCAALLGCRAARGSSAAIREGTYYTRFALQFEKDAYRTTNYRRGLLLPINTQVTVLSSGGDRIEVRIEPEGRTLTVQHVPKHTHDTLEEAFAKIFAKDPVELSGFTPAEQEAIAAGRARVGIGKKAVLAALGPPPASGTLSLESREWRYWDTIFSSYTIRFDERGQVIDVGR